MPNANATLVRTKGVRDFEAETLQRNTAAGTEFGQSVTVQLKVRIKSSKAKIREPFNAFSHRSH